MRRGLTWKRSGQSEDAFKRYLVLALARSGVCVALENEASEYLFVANLFKFWSIDDDDILTDQKLFGHDLAERLKTLKSSVRQDGQIRHLETDVDGERFFEFIIEAVPSDDEQVDVMTTIVDLTNERLRERVLHNLLREVSHRTKNLMAIVHSIATQTAKYSVSIDHFLRQFRGRLYSLSRTQDLVTASDWRGAYIADLLKDQTQKYQNSNHSIVEFVGDNVILPANASLHVGLALYELVSNMAPLGRCAVERSHAKLTSKYIGGEKPEIELVWLELRDIDQFGDTETALASGETDNKFGTIILENVVPKSVNGTARYEVTSEHILYALRFPLGPEA